MKEISLRPIQQNAINLIRDAFRTGHRKVILQAPCSFGKTRTAAQIIKSIIDNGKRVYFICDRITLIDQAADAFSKFDIPLGVIQGNNELTDYSKPLQVCSIQSLKNRKNLPHADVCIVDECHSVYQAQIDLMEKWNNVKFIGLTATAYTKGLGKIWDTLVIGARTSELEGDKLLVPMIYYGAPIGCDLKKVKIQAGDYNQKDLGTIIDKPKIIGDIVKNWKVIGSGRQTLCFAVNIVHSKHIVDEFNRSGIPASHIDCYTPSIERQELYKKFNSGEIRILSSVDVLTKGFDSPIASCLILARPTKSLIVYIQSVGRGARLSGGKENCIVLDHGGNVARHGFTTDPLPELLCMGDKNEAVKDKKEKPLPKPCSKCFFMKPPKTHKCPNCGFMPAKQNEVTNTDDKLEMIKKVDVDVKTKWFSMLLYHARLKKYSDGWASHKYKEKFGVWPHKKTGIHPTPPDDEVTRYVKYIMIKSSKGYNNANKR